MAIVFSCQCGKQIKVADKFAGRSGKCPACGGAITIPTPDAPDVDTDLLYEALGPAIDRDPEPADAPDDGTACGACGKPMPGGAVLCTHCGFNRISLTYIKSAKAYEAKEKESRAPLLTIAGMDLHWWKLALIIIPVTVVSYWYFTGPARDLLVLNVQTVNVIESIHSGETREPFSLFTQQGDMSLGLKGPKSKSNPNPLIGGDEVYSLGSSDKLLIIGPDKSGNHIALEVALKQGTIRDKGRISGYKSIIAGKDFKLVPADGSPPLDARLLYKKFDNGAELDIGGAQTTDYNSLFPTMPTELDMDREFGTINGKAYWSNPYATGKITFTSSYSYGDNPPAKGLNATGKLKLTNDAGTIVNMNYNGGTLNVDWDPDASGWWSKRRFDHYTQPSPWYRYHVGLLFERPDAGGDYRLTYCGKDVATVSIDPLPPPKTIGVSPIKRVNSKNKPAKSSNNPLAYFTVLADARQQARGIVSASNLRQLGIGLQIYLDQNNQVWPDRIDQLESVMSGYELVMVNPRTGAEIGFIYVRPEPGADPSTTAVLHESFLGKPDPNGAVLYADGHIE